MTLSRHLRARPRLLTAVGLGLLLFLALAWVPPFADLAAHTRAALSINVAAILFLGLTWRLMVRSSKEGMLRRARLEDEGPWVILIMTASGIVLSILIIVMELHGAKDLPRLRLAAHTGLAVLTILSMWFVTHTLFALRYAHLYYMGHKGLRFPGQKDPEYLDFLYQSITVAVTGATSDVEVSSPVMRHTILAQSVVAFFLNLAVLGMTINILAGLI